jgi:RimJ/RimL family protein N-acetyltransferase/aryl carrier-like protein
MTTIDAHIAPADTAANPRREAYRRELAALIQRDTSAMPDSARLVDELALDSLAMMSMLCWLEDHGVAVDVTRDRPASVGEVLSLLEQQAAFPQLTIRMTDGPDASPFGPSNVTVRPAPPTDPLAPVMGDQAIRLVPVAPDDAGFLYALTTDPQTCFRWRYRGAPPSFDRFAADLWNHVLVQYVARRAADNQPIGHVVAYGADPAMRYLYIGAVFIPPYAGTGMAAHVAAMFVRYLFHTFPLHKIYLEVPGFNWPQVQSGQDRVFRVEGVLRDHDYYGGRYWDQYLCAIYRDHVTAADAEAAP